MNKIYTYIVVTLFSASVFYAVYKAVVFYQYVKIYNDQVENFSAGIEYYSNIRMENVPNQRRDFDEMITWLRKNSNVEEFLDYGVNFIYNTKDNSLSVYSYGIDKKNDSLNSIIQSSSTGNHQIFGINNVINTWDFRDLFWTYGKDVFMFKIYLNTDYLCRNFIESGLYSNDTLIIPYSQSFIFIVEDKIVKAPEKNNLIRQIKSWRKSEFKNKIIDESTELSFIRYKNEHISTVCDPDPFETYFNIDLKVFFQENNIDYAILPILK
jgi:hypothetical protein